MKQIFHITLYILVSSGLSRAQEHYLELNPDCNSTQSPFTSTLVIDNLADNQLLGFVQKGAFNRIEKIHYKGALPTTIGKFFTSNNSSEKSHNLVVVLNELFLSETTKEFSESGRLKLALRLFTETDDGKYAELISIDSIYTVKGMDVTKKLLRSVSEQLCKISEQSKNTDLGGHENKKQYHLTDLYKLDSLDKLDIPLYASAELARGIYKDYKHLKMNTPDDNSEIFIDLKKPDKIKVYKVYKANNRKIQLETEGIYAVSDGKRLYKATAKNFYEVKKIGNDFFYDRPAQLNESNVGAIAGGAAFGVVGALIGSGISGKASVYRYRINYRRGNSVPVEVVE